MKTLDGWNKSGVQLNEYLQVGNEVDEDMVNYFIDILPPATMRADCMQIGEPWDHDPVTCRPMFATLEKQDGKWIYTGHRVRPAKAPTPQQPI